jgi:hypothetical protein
MKAEMNRPLGNNFTVILVIIQAGFIAVREEDLSNKII